MQGGWAARENDAGERTFAETNLGLGAGGGHEQRTEKAGEIRIVSDDEQVLTIGAFAEELLEFLECGLRGERGGVKDLGLVAGFCADQGCGLEAPLQGARDDEVELDVESIQYVSELDAVLFAFLVERALGVEQWIRAS